jgi:membrane-bound lytic murein transglycosylase MltF
VIIKQLRNCAEERDLIEMVNAGLIPLIVVDKHKARLRKRIFPKITVHDGVCRAPARHRLGDPQGSRAQAALDDFTLATTPRPRGKPDPDAAPQRAQST